MLGSTHKSRDLVMTINKIHKLIGTSVLLGALVLSTSVFSAQAENLEIASTDSIKSKIVDFNDELRAEIDANSKYILRLTNIADAVTHIKLSLRAGKRKLSKKLRKKLSKKSNLKFKNKVYKVKTDVDGNSYIEAPFKSLDFTSINEVEIKLIQKRRRKARVMGAENLRLRVAGTQSCPQAVSKVCGVTELPEVCDEDTGICLPAVGTRYKTYNNFCQMEEAGAQFKNFGNCGQEGTFIGNEPVFEITN